MFITLISENNFYTLISVNTSENKVHFSLSVNKKVCTNHQFVVVISNSKKNKKNKKIKNK